MRGCGSVIYFPSSSPEPHEHWENAEDEPKFPGAAAMSVVHGWTHMCRSGCLLMAHCCCCRCCGGRPSVIKARVNYSEHVRPQHSQQSSPAELRSEPCVFMKTWLTSVVGRGHSVTVSSLYRGDCWQTGDSRNDVTYSCWAESRMGSIVQTPFQKCWYTLVKKKKKKINEVIYFVYTINPFLGG